MDSLIMWEESGSSLTVAVSIEEISGSRDVAATAESSGCFWCVFMSLDKASACPIEVVERYFIEKSKSSRVVAHRCNRLAVYTGIFFLDPKMLTRGLWSVTKRK